MSKGRTVPTPTVHNGHRVEALDQMTQTLAGDLADPSDAERPRVPEMALEGSSEIFSAADEPLRPEPFGRRDDASRRPDDARGRRPAGSSDAEAGRDPGPPGGHLHMEDLLSTVRSYAESMTVQARADAEELLSRAHAQAELLRVRAEAVRAEAECLRAEAAALRIAVRDDAEAANERAKSAAQTHAAAEELRALMQREADAAREEFERMRTEAMAIRRLLRAEVDAGVFDTERTRAEIQRLWAETDKLAVVLRRVSAGAETTGSLVETSIESGIRGQAGRRGTDAEEHRLRSPAPGPRPVQPPLDGAEPASGLGSGVVEERLREPTTFLGDHTQPDLPPGTTNDLRVVGERPPEVERAGPRSVSAPVRGEPQFDNNAAERLLETWEVVSAEPTREHRSTGDPVPSPGFVGARAPEPGPVSGGPSPAVEAPHPSALVAPQGGGTRSSQPLIGSGGWQQKHAPGTHAVPGDASPLPASTPRRRRFRRA